VYRIVEGKSTFTPVKAGSSDLTHTIVLDGINEGDWIVIGPYKVLEDIEHGKDVEDPSTASESEGDTTKLVEKEQAESTESETSTANLATSDLGQ
jgi:hypothetical protein